jgi:hypothetical protein
MVKYPCTVFTRRGKVSQKRHIIVAANVLDVAIGIHVVAVALLVEVTIPT